MTKHGEGSTNVRTDVIVILVVVTGALLFVSPASAQQPTCEEILDTRSTTPTGPGGQLADAIGDQRSEIGSELDDRRFDAKLANATSDRESARIIANETERVEERLATLERCWGSNGTAGAADGGSAELDPGQRDALRNRTRSLQQRVNETRVEAGRLDRSLREAHGIDAAALTTLERRVESLRAGLAGPGGLSTPSSGQSSSSSGWLG